MKKIEENRKDKEAKMGKNNGLAVVSTTGLFTAVWWQRELGSGNLAGSKTFCPPVSNVQVSNTTIHPPVAEWQREPGKVTLQSSTKLFYGIDSHNARTEVRR